MGNEVEGYLLGCVEGLQVGELEDGRAVGLVVGWPEGRPIG